MSIRRYSSRMYPLGETVLLKHLEQARSYKRIAGYFSSSLFEVAGERLEAIPDVKIVCNVDLHPDDLLVAQLREVRMISRWNEKFRLGESLMNKERYARLDSFLGTHGQMVRVVPNSVCGFLHGKAGVIERIDGKKLSFIGSMNETSSGWTRHYEILWEDSSPEGVAWVEEEFEYLWKVSKKLPDMVFREIRRRGFRQEISVYDINDPQQVGPAALVESPLYQEGFSLQPWQRGFLAECLRHYSNHGVIRLILADEVGLGKTLSLGAASLIICLVHAKARCVKRPMVIFSPASLCEQWQTEMIDKLGIPCGRWDSNKKNWLDYEGRQISPNGSKEITRCPLRIGIVSTGLLQRQASEERRLLSKMRFDLVVIDEAHRARSRRQIGGRSGQPNELLSFAKEIAGRSQHVLLGTGTPIQTQPEDLWDLLTIIQQGNGYFVLGNEFSKWHKPKSVLPYISGRETVTSVEQGWELLRSPLPAINSTNDEDAGVLFGLIRRDLELGNEKMESESNFSMLSLETQEIFEDQLEKLDSGATFFQRENPLTRHIVLRKRVDLENRKMIPKIAVDLHPNRDFVSDLNGFDALFCDNALRTDENFRNAYLNAQKFGENLAETGRRGGLMKNLLEQRICSSIAAGLCTVENLLNGKVSNDVEENEIKLSKNNHQEMSTLKELICSLQKIPGDPKINAISHFLVKEGWLRKGVIIFSQYFDTANWIASSLHELLPLDFSQEIVGLYAGSGKSKIFRKNDNISVDRSTIKRMVVDREIKVMVATDAASEGLNLQTLGALINVDLPWNPTRLQQRLGRIKRFGQVREKVDMLNLVNEQTVDQKIYSRLSERMQERYDIFGSIPDVIEDDWIDDIEALGKRMDEYINAQRDATGFDLRYRDTVNPDENDWREVFEVLSRQEFLDMMRSSW